MIRAWTREPRPCPPRARQEGHPRRFTVSHGATGSAPGLCDRRSAGRGHLLMRAGGRVGLMLTSRVYPGGGRGRRLAGGGVPITDPAPGQGMCAGDRRRSGPWRHGQLGPVRTEGASVTSCLAVRVPSMHRAERTRGASPARGGSRLAPGAGGWLASLEPSRRSRGRTWPIRVTRNCRRHSRSGRSPARASRACGRPRRWD
jgi:hypothetical protein